MAIQWAGWALASALRTEKFYDLTGSLTFITLATRSLAAAGGLASAPPRSRLLTGLVCLWAARLGTFLVRRVRAEGKDSRFDGVRDQPSRFFVFWTLQGVWVFITSLPLLLLNAAPSQRELAWSDALGACPRRARISLQGLGLCVHACLFSHQLCSAPSCAASQSPGFALRTSPVCSRGPGEI
jgi:steroid 5-alpha reductase family enzyme